MVVIVVLLLLACARRSVVRTEILNRNFWVAEAKNRTKPAGTNFAEPLPLASPPSFQGLFQQRSLIVHGLDYLKTRYDEAGNIKLLH